MIADVLMQDAVGARRRQAKKMRTQRRRVCNKLNNKWAHTMRCSSIIISSQSYIVEGNLSLFPFLSPPPPPLLADNFVAFRISSSCETHSRWRNPRSERRRKAKILQFECAFVSLATQTMLVRSALLFCSLASLRWRKSSRRKKERKKNKNFCDNRSQTEVKWKECDCSNRRRLHNNNG